MKKQRKNKIKTWWQKRQTRKAGKILEQIRGQNPDVKTPNAFKERLNKSRNANLDSFTSNKNTFKLPKPKTAKIHKMRRLAKTVQALSNKREFKKNEPILRQKQFKKLLKANIEKNINTGNFKKAKELLPYYRELIKGKMTAKRQAKLEQLGAVGIYTADNGKKGYTIYKVYNKFKLDKIMPNDALTPQQYRILQDYLGYSARTIKTLKERQFMASITPEEANKNIERAERDFRLNGLSWSGSPDFDLVMSYMGGFKIALSKYEKVVREVAERYGVSLDDLINDYLPNFAD